MNYKKYFSNIKGNDLKRNIYTADRFELMEKYVNEYSFLKKDQAYIEFLKNLNGIGVFNSPFIIIIYGFALEEADLHLSPSNYEKKTGYLAITEFVEKKKKRWKSIGYYYKDEDELPIIYSRFAIPYMESYSEVYFPLCIGFENFLNIVMNKDYDEQFDYVTKKNKFDIN